MKLPLFLLATLLLAGCSKHAAPTAPPVASPPPPVTTQAAPTTVAAVPVQVKIKGAFGFELGATLPSSYEVTPVESGGYGWVSFGNTNFPPFDTILVYVTDDRTIYLIDGSGNVGHDGLRMFDLTIATLKDKYGQPHQTFIADEREDVFISAGRQIEVSETTSPTTLDDRLEVSYSDLELKKKFEAESLSRRNAADKTRIAAGLQ